MKGFPYQVTIKLEKTEFKAMLAWLHGQGHVLRTTMEFGKSHNRSGDSFVTQQVCFIDKGQAAMFKLAWGGA